MSHKPLRIFISSSSVGLEDYRAIVQDTILRLGQFPLAMEYFGTQPGGAVAVSVASLAEADVYVLIVAWRYGTIRDGEARSVTQVEYDEAVVRELPRFVYLAAPSTEHDEQLFPPAHRDHQHRDLLHALRQRLELTELRSYFTTPQELGRLVAVDLGNYLRRLIDRQGDTLLDVVPRILPPRPASFVGRDQELDALCEQLRRGRDRGISIQITGMGGIGKSTLAAEVIHRLAEDQATFSDGVVTISCNGQAGLVGLEWIYDRILAAWRIVLSSDVLVAATTEEQAVSLREDALRTRLPAQGRALLLLDNVEKELPVDRLVEITAGLGFATLMTSRVQSSSLRLYQHKIDVLPPDAAVQLFVERYTARGGNGNGYPQRETVSEIVMRLGYLPLAISLAAARAGLRQIDLQVLLRDLAEPMSLDKLRLPGGSKEGVRQVLDQSVRSLSGMQQARFAALGALENTEWPREIVESLLGALQGPGAGPADDDLDLLATYSLVDLLARPGEGSDGPQSRVHIHPMLHELAREYWQAMPQDTRIGALEGLLGALNDFVQAYNRDFSVLEREEILLVGAINSALHQRVATEAYRNLITSLDDYLNFGGRWNLYRALLQERVQADRRLGDLPDESLAALSLGNLASRQGRYGDAERYYLRCLDIAHALNDREVECQVLNNLGTLAFDQHSMRKSRKYYERALSIARHINGSQMRDQLLGQILMNLGVTSYSQRQFSKAATYYRQSLSIRRALGDRAGESQTLSNLGLLEAGQRHFDRAREDFAASLHIVRQQPVDLGGQGQVLGNLGNLAADQGQVGEAQRYYEEALTIFDDIGATHLAQMVRENLQIVVAGQAGSAHYPSAKEASARHATNSQAQGSVRRNEWLRGRRSKAFVRAKPTSAPISSHRTTVKAPDLSAEHDVLLPTPEERADDALPAGQPVPARARQSPGKRRFPWL